MRSFEEYFSAIGVGEPIQKRISEILGKIKKLNLNVDFTDVSINEYLDKDGIRHFTDIRFYSNNIIVNVADFLIEDDFYVSGACKNILTLKVQAKNYDFVQANESSRLRIIGFLVERPVKIELNGTGTNCDYMFDIYKKHLLPRLVLP